MQPTISVIIPHYGADAPTLALVELLRPQLDGIGEIIVVDDHSPDTFPDHPGALVVHRASNGGFGSACNSGAAAATGQLLLFLNSDTTVGPAFVVDLVTASAPWQPCVAGPRICEGHSASPSARHFPTIGQQVVDWLVPLARFHNTRIVAELLGHDRAVLESGHPDVTDWLVGAALLIPRDEFHAVGGFDERFFMNCEEVDLQRRLRARGVPSVFIPGVVIHHVGGGSSDPEKRRRWVAAAQDIYAAKWGGVHALRAALTAATLVNLAWNVGRRLCGRSVRPLVVARFELGLIHGNQAP